jgi:hypothetical protein
MLTRRVSRTALVAIAACVVAITLAWLWIGRPPSAQTIASQLSIALPDGARVTHFDRFGLGPDAAFVAELGLPDSDGANLCKQIDFAAGPASKLPAGLESRLSRSWYGRALCHKAVMRPSHWEVVVVQPDAVVVYYEGL